MTIEELLELFLIAKHAQRRRPKTIVWYRENMKWFVTWLRENECSERVVDVTPEVIDRFLAHESERLAASSLHGRWRVLSVLFNWAESRPNLKRELHRRQSPIQYVEAPQVEETEQRAVSYSEWKRLIEAIDVSSWVGVRDYLVVCTFFLSGIRVGELIRLQVEDFDLEGGILKIRQGKREGYQIVPLLPMLARAFMAYLFVRPEWPTSHVFLAADGWKNPDGVLTISGVYQLTQRLARRAGVQPTNPHAFRHGLAQYLLNEKDAEMVLIQRILRHKKLETTSEIYARYKMAGLSRRFQELMGDASQFL